jgi:hypothetical protein
MTAAPFAGLPPLNLSPGTALVFQASLWWATAAYGPRHYERHAREALERAIIMAPGDLAPVYARVRDAARSCVTDPADPDRREALSRALDGVLAHARRQPPSGDRQPVTAADDVWWAQ